MSALPPSVTPDTDAIADVLSDMTQTTRQFPAVVDGMVTDVEFAVVVWTTEIATGHPAVRSRPL